MIKQINKKNVGIDITGDAGNIPLGYQHGDGLLFDDTHPSWILHKNYEILSKDILKEYPKAMKILDIGSGAGNLRYCFKESKPELVVVTLDGNMETINSPLIDVDTHFLLRTDVDYTLSDENDEIIKFDVICSFEHFEHIEPQYFDVFINNIKKHSHKDTVLIASAANWKYDNSDVHCNVKTSQEWEAELTKKYGMKKINKQMLNHINWSTRIKHTFELYYKVYE